MHARNWFSQVSVTVTTTAAALAAVLAPAPRAAETPATQLAKPRPMSLRECVEAALARNFDIQIQRFNPRIAELNLNLVSADYDPTMSLSVNHQTTSEQGGFDNQNRPFDGSQSEANTVNGSVNGLLPTGLTYSMSANASDTFGTRPGSGPFEAARASWTVANLRQPLLRNSWIDGTRLNLKLRRRDLNISQLALADTVQDVVTRVEQTYFDLVTAIENVRNAQKSLELADRLFQDDQRRVKIGILAALDEKEAQSQMASSRASLIAAHASVTIARQQLRQLITDRYESEPADEIQPTDALEFAPPDLDFAQSRARALELRPDLQQAAISVEQRNLTTRFQRNQLLPQLDVIGSLGYSGIGAEYGGALGNVAEGNAPFHGVGASLSFPLSNRRARTNYRVGQTQASQAEFQLRRLRQAVVGEIDDAIVRAQSAFERVGATLEARQFAEAALAAEEKKLSSGRSTSFIVLQIQQRLTSARLEELRAQADFNKSLSTLRQREGRTLQHHRIQLFETLPTVLSGSPTQPKP